MHTPRSLALVLITLSAAAVPALAQAQFTSGTLTGTGFPEPAVFPPVVVAADGGSGSGSTGGGIGLANASVTLTAMGDDIGIALMGSSSHNNTFGLTAYFASPPLVFQLDAPATFAVVDNSTRDFRTLGSDVPFDPVTFSALTGLITGDPTVGGTLSPGTYQISFAIRSGDMSNVGNVPDDVLAADMNWRLTMTVPTPGTALLFSAAAFALCLRRRR